jgi:hypothetical protein
MQQGRHHAGIVVSIQRPIGDTLRRLLRLAGALDADALGDRLQYLGDWQRATTGPTASKPGERAAALVADFRSFLHILGTGWGFRLNCSRA